MSTTPTTPRSNALSLRCPTCTPRRLDMQVASCKVSAYYPPHEGVPLCNDEHPLVKLLSHTATVTSMLLMWYAVSLLVWPLIQTPIGSVVDGHSLSTLQSTTTASSWSPFESCAKVLTCIHLLCVRSCSKRNFNGANFV